MGSIPGLCMVGWGVWVGVRSLTAGAGGGAVRAITLSAAESLFVGSVALDWAIAYRALVRYDAYN